MSSSAPSLAGGVLVQLWYYVQMTTGRAALDARRVQAHASAERLATG